MTPAPGVVSIGAVKEAAFQRHMLRDSSPKQDPFQYATTLVDAFWQGVQPPVIP